MSGKTEKVCLVGPSGSGKDYLMRKLTKKGLLPGLKTTTRPPRKNEVNGISYDFISNDIFINNIDNDIFLFWNEYLVTPENQEPIKWYYGLTKEEFNKSQVFIMTPNEVSTLTKDIRSGCFVVYLDIDEETRRKRIGGRGDKNDSVDRRIKSDYNDFKGFVDYDLRITDPDFTADDIWELIL